MLRRRIGLALCLVALFVVLGAASASAAMEPVDVVGQEAPKLVPHSTLPGPGAFEGPVNKLAVNGIEIGYRQFGHGPDLIMVTGDTASMSLWHGPDTFKDIFLLIHTTCGWRIANKAYDRG